jgi:hypothetical protein
MRAVRQDAPGVDYRCASRLTFDGMGRAWAVWDNSGPNTDSDEISSSFWQDTAWSAEHQVSLPESCHVNYQPYIASGGGALWCVWYGGPNDVSAYSVYASYWDTSAACWAPPMLVSPKGDGWWCDVAVDQNATPRVVWCSEPYIYYSYYDGKHWVGPTVLNDTLKVAAAPYAAPMIARLGVKSLLLMYCCL